MSPARTVFSTLPLHDALPIWTDNWTRNWMNPAKPGEPCPAEEMCEHSFRLIVGCVRHGDSLAHSRFRQRSEEHTSELQSLRHLVCRLLLEKKKIARPQRSVTT